MNTDKEMIGWLKARFKETEEAFGHPNLEDKMDNLFMLYETTRRIMDVVEAQAAVGQKPYSAKYVFPWLTTTPSPGGEKPF